MATGYLAVAHTGSPYVTIYAVDGDTRTKITDPSSLPSAQGRGAAFSPDGTYLAVTSSSPTYLAIYKRSGDVFTKLTGGDGPDVQPEGDSWVADWSPDGTYLAIGHGGSSYISVYKRSGDTFTRLARPATLPTAVVSGVRWSPSGDHLAVADAGSSLLRLYKRTGDALAQVDTESAGSNPLGIGWSPSGTYVTCSSYTSPDWYAWSLSGDTLTPITGLPVLAGNGQDTDWDPTETYVAVAHYTTPFMSVFKRSGTTFTKISDPASLPSGAIGNATGGGIRWSPDGLHVSKGSSTTPYLETWSFDSGTDTLTKLSNPATLPAGSGGGVSYYYNPPPSTVDVVGTSSATSTAAAQQASTGPIAGAGSAASSAAATAEGVQAVPTYAELSFPAITLTAYGNYGADLSLPALSTWELVAESLTAVPLDGDNTIPMWTLDAVNAQGTVCTADATLPALTLAATAGDYASLEITFSLEAAGLAGNVGVADATLPAVTLEVEALVAGVATAVLLAPRMSMAASGSAENVGAADVTLKPIALTAAGVVGYDGQADLEMPQLELVATAFSDNIGTADNELELWYLDADAFAIVVASYRAWALNVRNAALTEYTGLALNSFGTFQGRVLAASADGLHVVGEADTDDGVNISAMIRTAIVDFDTSYNKRVPRAYVGLKSAKDMEFRTITTHDGTRAYLIPHNGNNEIQQRRAPIGRGPKSRFWQFEVANRDGGDFTAADILVYPEAYGRRVV